MTIREKVRTVCAHRPVELREIRIAIDGMRRRRLDARAEGTDCRRCGSSANAASPSYPADGSPCAPDDLSRWLRASCAVPSLSPSAASLCATSALREPISRRVSCAPSAQRRRGLFRQSLCGARHAPSSFCRLRGVQRCGSCRDAKCRVPFERLHGVRLPCDVYRVLPFPRDALLRCRPVV